MFNFNATEFRIPFNVLKATKRLINIIDNKNFQKQQNLFITLLMTFIELHQKESLVRASL